MNIGPKESSIGVRVRGFWAGVKLGKRKPEWSIEWGKSL